MKLKKYFLLLFLLLPLQADSAYVQVGGSVVGTTICINTSTLDSSHMVADTVYYGTYPDTSNYVQGGLGSYNNPLCAADLSGDPAGDYWIQAYDFTIGTSTIIYSKFTWDGFEAIPEIPDVPRTGIISVFPNNGEVVSTSTPVTIGWTHTVDPADYVEGIRILFRAYNVTAYQSVSVSDMLDAQGGFSSFLTGSTTQPMYATTTILTASGDGGFSYNWDMSDLPIGRYTIQATMILPEEDPEGVVENVGYYLRKSWNTIMLHLENIDGVPNEVPSNALYKSSSFVLQELSYYDEQYDLVKEFKSNRNCSNILSVTGWFSTESPILDCLTVLFIPTDEQFASLWTTMVDSVLSVFPLGYITRTVTIFTETPPTTPPDITYTYGYSAPVDLQGKGFSMDIWSQFYLLNDEIKSDTIGAQKTIWEIVQPYFAMMVALAVWSMIIYDLIALGLPDFGGAFNARSEELEGEYQKSGSIAVGQLPDQPYKNRPTYGQEQNVRIINNRGKNTIPKALINDMKHDRPYSKSIFVKKK